MMLRCAIVDDEPLALGLLESYVLSLIHISEPRRRSQTYSFIDEYESYGRTSAVQPLYTCTPFVHCTKR